MCIGGRSPLGHALEIPSLVNFSDQSSVERTLIKNRGRLLAAPSSHKPCVARVGSGSFHGHPYFSLEVDLGLHPYTRALQERGHDVHSLDKNPPSCAEFTLQRPPKKHRKKALPRKSIKKNSELNQTSTTRLRKSLKVQ